MSEVNGKRLLAAGLVTAIVMALSRPGEEAVALLLFGSLLLGVTAVWLYTQVSVNYGTGPRTALRTGLAVALLACGVPNLGMLAYGVFTPDVFLILTAAALVQVPVATVVGAMVYGRTAGSGSMVAGTARA